MGARYVDHAEILQLVEAYPTHHGDYEVTFHILATNWVTTDYTNQERVSVYQYVLQEISKPYGLYLIYVDVEFIYTTDGLVEITEVSINEHCGKTELIRVTVDQALNKFLDFPRATKYIRELTAEQKQKLTSAVFRDRYMSEGST